jgi:hypothetical protein
MYHPTNYFIEIDSLECLGRLARVVSGDDTNTIENNWESELYTEVFAWGSNHAGQMGLGAGSSGSQVYGVP